MTGVPVPPDFPEPAPVGGVSGAQPKVLARYEASRFVAAGELRAARFEVCEDLAVQLVAYGRKKALEHPEWTPSEVAAKVDAAVRQRSFGWGLSPAEAEWVLKRLDQLRSKGPDAAA